MLLLLHRFSHVRLCATPKTAAHQASRPWDSPGKNTGVGCHFLLQCTKVKSESEVAQCPTLATPWTAAYQASPSMRFSRQKYWSGVPLPSPKTYNRLGKTRDFFKKIRDTKETFHAQMGSINDRNGMDLTEVEGIKK